MYYACHGSNAEMVKLLLSHNADPNIIPHGDHEYAVTTLMAAAIAGNVEIIKLLLNLNKTFKHSFDWVCFCVSIYTFLTFAIYNIIV